MEFAREAEDIECAWSYLETYPRELDGVSEGWWGSDHCDSLAIRGVGGWGTISRTPQRGRYVRFWV